MGYTTDFDGSLKISRPLTKKQIEYINLLCDTRRMKRDVNVLMSIHKGKLGNPFAKDKTNAQEVYGHEGEFFANNDGRAGQNQDESILDYNCPPGQKGFAQGHTEKGQPGLWCQWEVSPDGDSLFWNGGEKFYNYVEWLEYLIKMFFIPWGRKLNGDIFWYGEDREDFGKIKVRNNEVFTFAGEVTYEDDKK